MAGLGDHRNRIGGEPDRRLLHHRGRIGGGERALPHVGDAREPPSDPARVGQHGLLLQPANVVLPSAAALAHRSRPLRPWGQATALCSVIRRRGRLPTVLGDHTCFSAALQTAVWRCFWAVDEWPGPLEDRLPTSATLLPPTRPILVLDLDPLLADLLGHPLLAGHGVLVQPDPLFGH